MFRLHATPVFVAVWVWQAMPAKGERGVPPFWRAACKLSEARRVVGGLADDMSGHMLVPRFAHAGAREGLRVEPVVRLRLGLRTLLSVCGAVSQSDSQSVLAAQAVQPVQSVQSAQSVQPAPSAQPARVIARARVTV